MSKSDSLPRLFWLWIPLLVLIAQAVAEAILPQKTLSALLSEGGPHEIFEFLIMTTAFLVAVVSLFSINWKAQLWLALWVFIAALSCFYVAGEEMSWGQQVLHWATPESWSAVNDQNETNLHNTTSWLDQKPRLLLEIGILIGGLIIPLIRRFKAGALPARFSVIYPPDILVVTAGMALIVNVVDRIDALMPNIVLFERASEVEELYLFYFVLLYLVVLRRRILQHQR